MGSYNFDGHKLAYHSDRVAQYIKTGDCFPLYAEISPVGSCNHRCLFCAYDYIGHPNRRLDTRQLLETVVDMAACGLKSIVLAGEGEPLLHPDIATIIAHIRAQGIDVGLYTNGHFLSSALAQRILPHLTFVRFSFNGGTPADYARVHQVKPTVFKIVLKNMAQAVRLKKQAQWPVDIGAQFVLINENKTSLYKAAEVIKAAGLDYLAVKPFHLQRPEQGYTDDGGFEAQTLEALFESILGLAEDRFSIVVRKEGFLNKVPRLYKHCRGCSFTTVINSAGDVATCLPYWDKPDFIYGNIHQQKFVDIWQGRRRKALQVLLEQELKAQHCPANCRPHAINTYLNELIQPTLRHVNFI